MINYSVTFIIIYLIHVQIYVFTVPHSNSCRTNRLYVLLVLVKFVHAASTLVRDFIHGDF
jgi:hypothetical protein